MHYFSTKAVSSGHFSSYSLHVGFLGVKLSEFWSAQPQPGQAWSGLSQYSVDTSQIACLTVAVTEWTTELPATGPEARGAAARGAAMGLRRKELGINLNLGFTLNNGMVTKSRGRNSKHQLGRFGEKHQMDWWKRWHRHSQHRREHCWQSYWYW